MSTTPPEAASPEELFTEMIQAANSRDLKKFYGCLTNEARKDQIELMLHDLGRGTHVAQGRSDNPAVDIADMLATPETASAVIEKYRLPRGREIRLDELPVGNFDQFVLDMWHALQSKKKPYIDEDSAMLELAHHGDWACAEVSTVQNRHGDETSFIYFKKVNGKWRVDMSPWWYPFAKELLTEEQKQRLTTKEGPLIRDPFRHSDLTVVSSSDGMRPAIDIGNGDPATSPKSIAKAIIVSSAL